MSNPIPVALWGRDHWSTLAYLETRCVDGGADRGMPDPRRMRCDPDLHPCLDANGTRISAAERKKYPTRLADGSLREDHDDWSCVEDMEAAGLLRQKGTGMHPVVELTEEGLRVCALLRRHKITGGQFGDFRLEGTP